MSANDLDSFVRTVAAGALIPDHGTMFNPWGDHDPVCTRGPVEATAAYVQAPYRLDVLPGVGHWVPEQAPEALADAVLWAVRTADAGAG